MLTRLSLRLRIFLFFCLLAVGSVLLAASAMMFAAGRAEGAVQLGPFINAFIIFTFFNTGFALGIWFLFDENLAKPITKLSADLRLRAHSGIKQPLNADDTRYLGDLGAAANALSDTMSSSVMETAEMVAHETQRLRAEKDRLTALLSEMPIASILLNPSREIVLYDAQAADVLEQIAPPRLKAPITDYFQSDSVEAAIAQLSEAQSEAAVTFNSAITEQAFTGRIKDLGGDGHMIFIDVEAQTPRGGVSRRLVFDFDLMNDAVTSEIRDTPLKSICYVPFDTETTGLSVKDDDIIQIGALRVLNGRIVDGEEIDTCVDPGRPIPPVSTKIHHITDADVKDAPDIITAGRALHHFCRDAVLVAHNAPFDIGLLRRAQTQIGVEWSHPVIDTVLLSAVVFGTTADHTLDALCERLSIAIPSDARHTALGDARATAEVLVKLLPLLEGKGISTFGQLLAETQTHARLLNDMND